MPHSSLTNNKRNKRAKMMRNNNFASKKSKEQTEEIIFDNNDKESNLSGSRIVDFSFMSLEIQKLVEHGKKCVGYASLISEKRVGFISFLSYKCETCNREITLHTQPANTNINYSCVWGLSSIGFGHSNGEELFSIMNIPFMDTKLFGRELKMVSEQWENNLIQQMYENAQEEKKLAIEANNIDNDLPFITVVVDGGWAKRLYGHGYTSNSGVACIIGYKTKKLLYLGVKNKFCYICSTSKREHVCYKNYSGSSPAMEQTIIVEGFQKSISDYGLVYKYLIGDGDSSVYNRILEKVSYGRDVIKLECANHATRAVTSHLYELLKNKSIAKEARNILESNIPAFSKYIRKIISQSPNTTELRKKIEISPYHIFGEHILCERNSCTENSKINFIPILKSSGLLEEVKSKLQNLLRKADRLVGNITTNYAELYMSKVSKFTGGKRINLCYRNLYAMRCHGAGLSYNQNSSFHKKLSPNRFFTNKYCTRKSKIIHRQKKHYSKSHKSEANIDYSPTAAEPDLPEHDFKLAKDKIEIELTNTDFKVIEESTIGQRENIKWFEARKNRLTSSNFGLICKRRLSTSPHNLLKSLFYKNKLLVNKAIQYGIENENRARLLFENKIKLEIAECGLFVHPAYPFLAASPDGIMKNALIEIKCFYKIRDMKIRDALNSNSKLCVKLNNSTNSLELDKKHNYYYQIQGQLNICKKDICYLVMYTNVDMEYIKIYKDEPFWQIMLNKLINFWNHYALPELADPRIPRGMRVRGDS